MSAGEPKRKWRPSLGMVVFSMLATVAMLPVAALLVFRLFDNQLLRQTERELIAQSAVLSAAVTLEVERAGAVPSSQAGRAERFHPIEPRLDVARHKLAPPRPDARQSKAEPDHRLATLGPYLSRLAYETQSVTLAGFRILDANGIVVAGGGDLGLSLAHVPEVSSALAGRYASVIRRRSSSSPDRLLPSLRRAPHLRIFTALPIRAHGEVAAVIYASRTPVNLASYIYGERWALMMTALTVLAGTGLTGFVLLRTINRPISRLLDRTRSLGNGDREALRPLDHYGTREIAALSQGITSSARKLFDRSDFLATFVAHLSHEFKSPLTSIRGAAEILRGDTMPDSERERFLGNIEKDAERLGTLVGRLRELARADTPDPGGHTTLNAITQTLSTGRQQPVSLAGAIDLTLPISLENGAIILSHLIDNALEHNARSVEITVGSDEDAVTIIVADDGDGVSDNNRDRIFEAFFTTKREAGGTGMGLAIVRSMIEAHGGTIDLLPGPAGCRFRIVFPPQF